MGTRGLYCVLQDDQLKVAQYGQWDAYPSGQGAVVLNFLREKVQNGGLDSFREAVRGLTQFSDDEVDAIWQAGGAGADGMISMQDADKVRQQYPALSRDVCGGIMALIDSGEVTQVHLRDGFAADSLFCEWAYVVNLDDNILEVYKGFQEQEHHSGRFADYQVEERMKGNYWPVALVAQFGFNVLPNEMVFEEVCEGSVLDRLANLEHEPQG